MCSVERHLHRRQSVALPCCRRTVTCASHPGQCKEDHTIVGQPYCLSSRKGLTINSTPTHPPPSSWKWQRGELKTSLHYQTQTKSHHLLLLRPLGHHQTRQTTKKSKTSVPPPCPLLGYHLLRCRRLRQHLSLRRKLQHPLSNLLLQPPDSQRDRRRRRPDTLWNWQKRKSDHHNLSSEDYLGT